ncbi:FixH family protein [Rossellomorea oryzaecorticis]|jgi:YtkA-like|uniref:FixH family protein n=1 Tax=Rossellomorea oryzaecorticis TaxID=1396505 RepID=A0ABW8VVI6_9BACI|nr:FixH family protein [[Bacillus] enclensis]MBH9965055.1 FixH family protein [[Bacillus] enclensis]QTC42778.1 FixH family protein [Bacillus sp. V3]QWC20969.1 FixH family protein [Bacillus haikouensis]
MKKSIMLLSVLGIILFLSACSENSKEVKESKLPEQVKADITAPEEVALNEATILEVRVTQGKEAVDNADEVKFEVWKGHNKDESKMFKGEHVKEGTYKIKTSFSEDGIYYVQTHVTARDMHVMPIRHILAGDVSEEELNALEESLDHDHDEDGHQH